MLAAADARAGRSQTLSPEITRAIAEIRAAAPAIRNFLSGGMDTAWHGRRGGAVRSLARGGPQKDAGNGR